ncbi:MAG: hypothetical protein P1U65_18255 [Minwuia sp.]|nr:hypothetical protein [Minwuia sp.]
MNTLTDNQRQTLGRIGDSLIPAALGMPSFTGAEAQGEMVDHVLALRPELLNDLRRALDGVAADEDAASATERLNREDPEALGAIGLVASSAYYLMPGVRAIMGYKGQEHRPASADEEHDYLRDNLLQAVVDRGPIYRDPGVE